MKGHIQLSVVSLSLLLASASAWVEFALRRGFQGNDFAPSGVVARDAQITPLDLAQNQSIHMVGGAENKGVGRGFQYTNLYSRGESTQSYRFAFSEIWSPQYGSVWQEWAKVPLTGRRITEIWTLESGGALTVNNGDPGTPCSTTDSHATCLTSYGSSARVFAGMDEPNVLDNPYLSHGQRSLSRQFNTSHFSIPAMDVRENSSLGRVRGPGQNSMDLSLARTLHLFECLNLEFRGDACDVLNHALWTGDKTTDPSGSSQFPFGQVDSAREARIGQVSAKLIF
jgi:hypothetical protein